MDKNIPFVLFDLPGYGKSTKSSSRDHSAHSKRAMGVDIFEALTKIVPDTAPLLLIGHDRGARCIQHMLYSIPEGFHVKGAVLMDIVPQTEMWNLMTTSKRADEAMGAFHWIFLAQPSPLPEKMIEAVGPDFFVRYIIERWTGSGLDKIEEDEGMQRYIDAFRDSAVVEASCEDYRAGQGNGLDMVYESGKQIDQQVLVIYSETYLGSRYDVPAVW